MFQIRDILVRIRIWIRMDTMFGSRIWIRIKLKSQDAVLQSQKPDTDPHQSRKLWTLAMEPLRLILEPWRLTKEPRRLTVEQRSLRKLGLGGSSGQTNHIDEESDPNPHQSVTSHPDPHQSKKSDPNPDSDLYQSENRIAPSVMRIRKTGSDQLEIVTWSRGQ